MNHWLMKTEPDEFSIDDLKARKTEPWSGVRNYQARNFIREMRAGDGVLFYHSSCEVPGVAGIASVVAAAYPDPTQFDPKSDYFDEKSRKEAPKWWHVDVKVTKKTPLLSLAAMRAAPEIQSMRVLQRGNRLSITPVSDDEWNAVTRMIDGLG